MSTPSSPAHDRSLGELDTVLVLRPPRRRRQLRPEPGAPLIVDSPEIREVLDTDTGRHVAVAAAMGCDYDRLVKLRLDVRSQMQRDDPLYRCSICGVPVHICRRQDGAKFYFKHRHEDGNCPAITKGTLSQEDIDARKYNGAKESRLHRQMKDWLCQCMALDGRFESIEQEPTWKGALTGQWRRPDVRAVYNGQPIAFEVQLSTTHLSVIAARRQFYLQEGGLLLWVFAEFDTEHRRMTDDDVFYNNNQNVFVVDANTVAASAAGGEFKVECIWSVPVKGKGEVAGLFRRMVSFHDLTLDQANQQAYFYDFAGERSRQLAEADAHAQAIRADFEQWWCARGVEAASGPTDWAALRMRLRRAGAPAPADLHDLPKSTLKALYSAKHGKPIADGRKVLVEVAHGLEQRHKRDLLWFSHALRCYRTGNLLTEQDSKKKWAKKAKELRLAREVEPEIFEPDREWQPLLEFLFPELAPLP